VNTYTKTVTAMVEHMRPSQMMAALRFIAGRDPVLFAEAVSELPDQETARWLTEMLGPAAEAARKTRPR